jgi:hypothetical protein
MYFTVVLMYLISAAVILVLSFAFIVQFSLPYKRVGKAKVFFVCILVCLWTFDGLKIVLMRPVIFKNFEILTSISFYPSHDNEHPR